MSKKSLDIKNLSTSVLGKFKGSRSGLISPEGELFLVALFGHLEGLGKRPEFADMVQDFKERTDEAEQDFIDSIPEGEHPGWHAFEIWENGEKNRLRTEILDKAYRLGWGRIGFVQKRPKPHLVELETHPDTVKTLKPYAQNVADMLDADLQVHEVEKGFQEP